MRKGVSKENLLIAKKMRVKIKQLRNMGWEDEAVEKLIKSLNLPLGLQLNLLNVRK